MLASFLCSKDSNWSGLTPLLCSLVVARLLDWCQFKTEQVRKAVDPVLDLLHEPCYVDIGNSCVRSRLPKFPELMDDQSTAAFTRTRLREALEDRGVKAEVRHDTEFSHWR